MQKSILVVDDDEIIRELLFTLLSENGFEVETAKNGVAAISRINEIKPDLVITDMKMPGGGGYEVIKNLQNLDPTPKSIAISGVPLQSDTILGLAKSIGADDIMEKPISEELLLKTVRKLIN